MNEKQTMKGNLKISCFDSFPFSELKPILEFIASRGYEIQFVDNGNIVCQKIEQDVSSTKGDAYFKSDFMNEWANNPEDDKLVDAFNSTKNEVNSQDGAIGNDAQNSSKKLLNLIHPDIHSTSENMCKCGHNYLSHSNNRKDNFCVVSKCKCSKFQKNTNSALNIHPKGKDSQSGELIKSKPLSNEAEREAKVVSEDSSQTIYDDEFDAPGSEEYGGRR